MGNEKYKNTKKKLLVESGIIFAALTVLGTGVYFLDDYDTTYQTETQGLQGKVSNIAAESAAIKEKYSKVQKNATLYQEATEKNAQNVLSIDRQELRDEFNLFKIHYNLNNVHLTMGVIADPTEAKYKHKNGMIVSSEVLANFEAVSDEDVYTLLSAIHQELSGSAKISKFTLTRAEPVTDEELKKINDKGFDAMVKGDMKFIWFGIKPVDASDDKQKKKP